MASACSAFVMRRRSVGLSSTTVLSGAVSMWRYLATRCSSARTVELAGWSSVSWFIGGRRWWSWRYFWEVV